jgi:two-component system CheB/CheR fusion protein
VLVVEDNGDAADTLATALVLKGHDVATAHTATLGLQKAIELRPEIVLCDLGLPGLDGYEVARAMRAEPDLASAYLIALSGYALPADVEKALAAGFDRHIAKPPDLQALEEIISEAPAGEARDGENAP